MKFYGTAGGDWEILQMYNSLKLVSCYVIQSSHQSCKGCHTSDIQHISQICPGQIPVASLTNEVTLEMMKQSFQ